MDSVFPNVAQGGTTAKPAAPPKVVKPKAKKKPAPKKTKKKTVAKKPKAKKKSAPKAKKTAKPVVRTERLDMRLSKAEKAAVVAKAKKMKQTITVVVLEAIRKLK